MWRTSRGDRTLEGQEARLVLLAVSHLREMITAAIELDCPHQTEVEIFNRLQPTQQLSILHEVAFALLDHNIATPKPTAIREATIYVLFRELLSLVEMEVEIGKLNEEPQIACRYQIVRACIERESRARESEWANYPSEDQDLTPTFEIPNVHSDDVAHWEQTIEQLANEILWDRDFELESLFADHDPQQTREVKEMMGIDQDYYSIPAPDSTSDEFRRLDSELVQLAID